MNGTRLIPVLRAECTSDRMPIVFNGDILQLGRDVLNLEAKAVVDAANRLDQAFLQATELILACTGRVVVTGVGKSGDRKSVV